MFILYNILVSVVGVLLKITPLFSKKMGLFINGRKQTKSILKDKIKDTDKTIWFHAASLGEYEQGIPVIEAVKKQYPQHKIVVSFFSPSGYEVRKNNNLADATVYLPLDTKTNVNAFLTLVHPDLVFFIKYEFWPNYLNALKQRNIPTYLVSGIFRPNQVFFKPYGGFYRRALKTFNHFFLQNKDSEKLIQSIGFKNTTVTGDTRFDRVLQILDRDNTLAFVEDFKKQNTLVVIGSSWPVDEDYLAQYINNYSGTAKFLFAPHNIKPEQIERLKSKITKSLVLYSEMEGKNLSDYQIMVVDTIGILTKIYSYADIAYVGGGFEKGIHNILEPATFGIPVIIGPKYKKFDEAVTLTQIKGCLVAQSEAELHSLLDKLVCDEEFRKATGKISGDFVKSNKDATLKIMNHITN